MSKLSIVTINYNNIEGLSKTIESVINQDFQDFEWIIIDGGSTDGSVDLIKENEHRISYWVSEKDNGIYNAMNKGIKNVTGEFCQFLNSGDSFIDNHVLSSVIPLLSDSDVYYGQQWCVKDGIVIEKRTYPEVMNLSYLFKAPLGHQASFFRTRCIKDNPYREKYTISADRAFYLELYKKDCKFEYLNLPIVFFDTEGIGSSPKTIEERRRQFSSIKDELYSAQVSKDIERLLSVEDEFLFVQRVRPIYMVYKFFKWIKKFCK